MKVVSTADIFDSFHPVVEVCSLQFRSFGKKIAFYGPVETLKSIESHIPVKDVLSESGEGRILVVDSGGSLRVGVLGDRLASLALRNGWTGVIINGAVRDSEAINDLGIGVKALGATARRNLQAGSSERGAVLNIGDVNIASGHWIYADADAVVVSRTPLDLSRLQSADPEYK